MIVLWLVCSGVERRLGREDVVVDLGVLDIADFLYFQNSFINDESNACDCDTSTAIGTCDAFGFLCYQDAFVSGCPSISRWLAIVWE